MVPMLALHIQAEGTPSCPWADIILPEAAPDAWLEVVLRRLCELASGTYVPCASRHINVDFQIPRGGGCSL